ncbi:MAG TPA: tetratricopeptide repeat protein [Thermoanaerobaculia bacterium]|nr:tetratricopeptide repeat protein [Thermoanaerobaculia bacterium]
MYRNRADRTWLAGLALGVLLALLAPAWAGAQTVSSPQVTGVEMTPTVRRTLKQLEEQWLQWIVQNNEAQANSAVEGLMTTARQLGMTRLPDLSAGAAARAVQAAREKDFPRARWALKAAERFDPGRPETAFAESRVNRLEGNYPGAVVSFLSGCPRLFSRPLERYLWLQDLGLWGLCLLLLTGGLFVAVQMATKGGGLFHDIADAFARRLPRPVALGLAALSLLWPILLPYGLLWLPLYWSVLLWGYGSSSERVVLVAVWLLVGVTPLLITEQRRRVALTLSPPVRAMESLEQHRLYGGLFADLGVLRSLLPESVAVKHFLADVHRSLGQWELARSLYRQVLEAEPENAPALLNLGTYFFLKGDFGSAIQSFQKVTAADPQNAAAQFNLSQAYSESYLFDESRSALAQAREIDDARVSGWVSEQQRVVTVPGGLERTSEIRRELLADWRNGEKASSRPDLFQRFLPLLVALGLFLASAALHLARRPFGYPERRLDARSGGFERWRRVLVPGFASSEVGEGGQAFAALLVPAALLMLPLFGTLGYPIPWSYDPGNLASWILMILGLLLYLGVRLRRELRDEV